MGTIIRGTPGIIQTQTQLSNANTGNGSTVYTYLGTAEQVVAKNTEMLALGYATEITNDGPCYTLNCSYNINVVDNPVEKEPENQWELILNCEEEGLLEADIPRIRALTTKTKTAIEYKLKHPETLKPWYEPEMSGSATYIQDSGEVYALMATGVKSRRIFTQTLKRTVTVSNRFNISWTQDTVGQVLSTSQLIGRNGVPANIAHLLWSSNYSILNEGDGVANNEIEVFYGWLDNGIQYRACSNNQIQISHEWLYNKWPTLMYVVVD